VKERTVSWVLHLPQTRTARFDPNGQPTGEVSDGDFSAPVLSHLAVAPNL
jgi:hypothetical protein